LLALLVGHDSAGLAQALQQRLTRDGLARFVLDTMAPMTYEVGAAWERGELQVFEEHLFTEQAKRVLRQAIGNLQARGGHPRILLTTPPDEIHALGLLMAEALFALEGAECIPLGPQMPLGDMVRAVNAHQADIVALSFSQAYPVRQVAPLLQQLRQMLPPTVSLWAGGAGVLRLIPGEGIRLLPDLADAASAIALWRAAQAAGQ
jgi:methanogenic corrinoid protein MtbC1